MDNEMRSLVAEGGIDAILPANPIIGLADGIVSAITVLASEKTRRAKIDAQCTILVTRINALTSENLLYLRERFKERGIAIRTLISAAEKMALSGQDNWKTVELFLSTLVQITNDNPLDAVSRRDPFKAVGLEQDEGPNDE
jgi:hypothetical protein